jgi:hypothetical protein
MVYLTLNTFNESTRLPDTGVTPTAPLCHILSDADPVSLVQYEMCLERAEAVRRSVHDGGMKTIMKLENLTTIDQLVDFLAGTQAVAFSVISDKDVCYRWIQGVLVRFRYLICSRRDKGVVIYYLMKVTGYTPPTPTLPEDTVQAIQDRRTT